MKKFAICFLATTTALRLHDEDGNVWDNALSGMNDVDEFNKETPKGYVEEKKIPKVDYESIARKKIEAEMKQKQALAQKEQMEKDVEDMDIELLTFSKELNLQNLKNALKLKEKMDEAGSPPEHFRVSVYSLW